MRIRHLLAALLLHAILLGFVLVGVYFHPVIRPSPVIEAVLVPAKRQAKAEPQIETPPAPKPEPKAEEPAQEKPQPKDDRKEQQQKEQKDQEKRVELQRKAELQKKAELEKKRADEELKLKKLEEQQRAQQIEQEEKRIADEKLKREREIEKRHQQELEAMLEQEKQGRAASERSKWAAQIRERVRRNWVRPINSIDKFQCSVDVQILPGGTIVNVKLTGSCGSPVLDESVKRAVWKSDPLPMPGDPDVFERNLNFLFVPGTN